MKRAKGTGTVTYKESCFRTPSYDSHQSSEFSYESMKLLYILLQ
jgi:hypothetical protein